LNGSDRGGTTGALPQRILDMAETTKPARNLPRHVAIIMDGNGRWARQRGMPRTAGHKEGATSVRRVVRACRERGIRYLTLYAFSLANWERPKLEVDALMRLLVVFAEKEAAELKERSIGVSVIGDAHALPTATRRAVNRLIETTNELEPGRTEPAMTLSLALSYSGRRDVVDAMRTVAEQAAAGKIRPADIDLSSFRSLLTTRGLPDVDLLIRSGGEQRLSDFLLFESAYAELYFTDVLWPDFAEHDLADAFDVYAGRERRFGRTGDQVKLARVK
jgi:undecaprenyl diphosphate synthase